MRCSSLVRDICKDEGGLLPIHHLESYLRIWFRKTKNYSIKKKTLDPGINEPSKVNQCKESCIYITKFRALALEL